MMSQDKQPQKPATSTLLLTDGDKKNLLSFLNRVPTKGIEEAQMLIAYAKGIQEAPPTVAPEEITEE